jgi:hypothetical protein
MTLLGQHADDDRQVGVATGWPAMPGRHTSNYSVRRGNLATLVPGWWRHTPEKRRLD